jgi:hypothetical protein
MLHCWDMERFLETMDRSFEDFHIEAITKAEKTSNCELFFCNIRDHDEPVPPEGDPDHLAVRWVEGEGLLTFTRELDTGFPWSGYGWLLYQINQHNDVNTGSLVRATVVEPVEVDGEDATLAIECNWSIVLSPPVSSELERAMRHTLERFYMETCRLLEILEEDAENAVFV